MPYQSYMKPVEHCMPLLHIGLQLMTLQKDTAGPFEAA